MQVHQTYEAVIIPFIELLNYFVPAPQFRRRRRRHQKLVRVRVLCAVYRGLGLFCPASLLSIQAWPTFSSTVVLILYKRATACSGHCRSTHLLFQIHSTGRQQGAWLVSTTEA